MHKQPNCHKMHTIKQLITFNMSTQTKWQTNKMELLETQRSHQTELWMTFHILTASGE